MQISLAPYGATNTLIVAIGPVRPGAGRQTSAIVRTGVAEARLRREQGSFTAVWNRPFA